MSVPYEADKAAKIISTVRAGCSNHVACAVAELKLSTFYSWLEDKDDDLIAEFKGNLAKAHAEAEVAAISSIRKAGLEGSWQAMAWWLETYRDDEE